MPGLLADGPDPGERGLGRADQALGRGLGQERTALRGHAEGLSALAFAPVGWQLATAAHDKTVKLWVAGPLDLAPLATLSDLKDEVMVAAFTPDGRTLVWGGKGKSLMFSTPPASSPLAVAVDIADTTALAMAPDGKSIAVGGWGGGKRHPDHRHDDANGRDVPQGAHRPDPDVGVLARRQAPRLGEQRQDDEALGGGDRSGESAEIPARPMPINEVRFTPDGKTLLVATGDWRKFLEPGELLIYDLPSRAIRATSSGHEGVIHGLAVAPDGKTFATGTPNWIRIWDAATGGLRSEIALPAQGVQDLDFSPDGRYLASGHYGGEIHLWDARSYQIVANAKAHAARSSRTSGSRPDSRTLSPRAPTRP